MSLNQKGIAPLSLIAIVLASLILGVYLVQNRTNIFPHAQQQISIPQTGFSLALDNAKPVPDNEKNYAAVYNPGEEIKVNVLAFSDLEAANTFSAVLNFPTEFLEVVSIQKESSSSAQNLTEPILVPAENQGEIREMNLAEANRVREARVVGAGCKVGGCSGQVCQNEGEESAITTCEYREQYACYKSARCEKQAGGQCGWTQTADLQRCIETANSKGGNQVGPGERCENSQICPEGYFCKPLANCNGQACTNVYGSTCQPISAQPSSSPMDCSVIADCAVRSVPEGCKFVSDGSCCGGQVVCQSPRPSVTKPIQDYFIRFWLPNTGFDNNEGKITLAGGVAGEGIRTSSGRRPIMATIVFKAKKAGEATIEFSDESLILRHSDSQNILYAKNPLTIKIQDPSKPVIKGDLDGDGIVGYKDFSMLLSKWGSNDPVADIDGDGKVGIFDFSTMLSNWTDRKG